MKARIYWLHALTPIHVGAGTSVGAVDQPVLREKATQWPYVPGSSIKGVIASKHQASEGKNRADWALAAFGKADEDSGIEGSSSGSLAFLDARLVCFPVASFLGTFAWTTSALALARLHRDLKSAGVANLPASGVSSDGGAAEVTDSSMLVDGKTRKAYLHDLDFAATPSARATSWAALLAGALFPAEPDWQGEFARRLIILPDDSFTYFARTKCEIAPRVKISPESKTVEKGKLWYEESVPAESVLSGLVCCDRIYRKSQSEGPAITDDQLLDKICESGPLQIGGKSGVGRGRVQCNFGVEVPR